MRDIDNISAHLVETELPPYLFTRIEAAIERKKKVHIPAARTWVMAMALVATLVIDLYMIRNKWNEQQIVSVQSLIEVQDNQLYHE